MQLPRALERAVAEDGSSGRRAWLADLPRTVDALAARWSLTLGAPFQPGGETVWVAPAGRDLVLKVGLRHPEAEHEADGLRAWRHRGAVRVHATHVEGATSALLLERAGAPLGELRPLPEQDGIVAGLLGRLWHAPPAGHPFPPLAQVCDQRSPHEPADSHAPGARRSRADGRAQRSSSDHLPLITAGPGIRARQGRWRRILVRRSSTPRPGGSGVPVRVRR